MKIPSDPDTRHNVSLRLHPLRLALISVLGLYGIAASAPVHANCTSSPSGTGAVYTVCSGMDGVDDDDEDKIGGPGPDINTHLDGLHEADAATVHSGITVDEPVGVIWLGSAGGRGVDAGQAGAGGAITLDNQSEVRLTGTTNGGQLGSLIYVASFGGLGDDDNDDNNSDGGDGGSGGTVSVNNRGALTIAGTVQSLSEGMVGLHAVSDGGTGGNQNSSMFGDQAGGSGGSGGASHIDNSADIRIGSADSRMQASEVRGSGIRAVSQGGKGGLQNGDAGRGNEVRISHAGAIQSYWNGIGDGSGDLYGIQAVSQGGEGVYTDDNSNDGGEGGRGGVVEVEARGTVLVDVSGNFDGNGAGILARSAGNKGGRGPSKDHSGGNGGAGGAATVRVTGTGGAITTRGNNMYGILAQSLGGEGGDGGDGAALAGQGGGAGFGGAADMVNVALIDGAAITTSGHFASGVLAQSVGGGGGTGGDFAAVLGGQSGNGGNGGDAAAVYLTSDGSISTGGDHAHGIIAQSIAGSGGAGGVSVAGLVSLGGDGAGGGQAGSVSATNAGTIDTAGYASHGIIGQSVGGGGGASGSAIGTLSVGGSAAGSTGSQGANVMLSSYGSINTTGDAAIGMIAQSIGGGGGSGGDSLGIAGIGGSGAAGGHGGAVTVRELGDITTSGDFSMGVLAQSIGGGGGNGGDTLTASVGASVGIGGSGAGGGNGGTVCFGNAGACDGGVSTRTQRVMTRGDHAAGIVAQSIGGGGGNGGSATNASLVSVAALQVGGSGGAGGDGDRVDIAYNGLDLQTQGARASGIIAQSIGGGGGNGGGAAYYGVEAGFNASLIMGGSGGDGGYGDAARVWLNDSHIGTGIGYAEADAGTYAPNDAFGILAQTIGGGGGNGGSASAAGFMVAVPTGLGVPLSVDLKATLGGTGGAGGHACPSGDTSCVTEVMLWDGSSVTTLGDGSHAILAQSIGGGGGSGGDASTMSIAVGYGDSVSGRVEMALGGHAGAASHGGAVRVELGDGNTARAEVPPALGGSSASLPAQPSSIRTYGNYANAVQAQSIGGGGGNGGVGSSNAYGIGGFGSVTMKVALGGAGGSGGNGGQTDVILHPNFTIQTMGSGARGILAQSIGGGGGASQGGTMGLSASAEGLTGILEVGLGQTGGGGGTGGAVNARVDGVIRTQGGDADAVVLQSIGGGGGVGGSIGADASSHPILDRVGVHLVNKTRLTDEGKAYSFKVDVGGRGGSGGAGGDVGLDFSGSVVTSGDWADGLVAQSIGGGGGQGGSSSIAGSKVRANVLIGVGGQGGTAGHGGNLTVDFDGTHGNQVATSGYGAHGVLLQSIGGGGGQGGDGSDQANGTLTIGGVVAGSGGTSGVGGAIRTGDAGNWLNSLTTAGTDAPAFVAQSIGGGGGVGGVGNSNSRTLVNSHGIALTLGGHGGEGNHGGEVQLALGANVATLGDRSHGFIAQSIGGGGGIGGAGDAGNLTSVALGGRGGSGGDGAAVSLEFTEGSSLSTQGAGAHGIVAQSIGGGGGIAGDSAVSINVEPGLWLVGTIDASELGGRGNGAAVDVTWRGAMETRGANAYGIIAQSVGGGGGLGGDASGGYAGTTSSPYNGEGSGGRVHVAQSGTLLAQGAGSTGIFAQSTGPQGGDTVTVDVYGQVVGGTGATATGVWIDGGRDNVLTVADGASISVGDGGTSVRLTAGQEAGATAKLDTHVHGTLAGDFRCEGGGAACSITVHESGTATQAETYEANVDNAGRVVAGSRPLRTTTVMGDYLQRSEGVLATDVDFAGSRAGTLVVLGDAVLDGRLEIDASSLMPGRELAVLEVEGHSHGTLQAPGSSIYGYALRSDGRRQLLSVASADFKPRGLGLARNHDEVAGHLQDIWDRGATPELAPLFADLGDAAGAGSSAYRDRLSDLSPGATLAPAARMVAGLTDFASPMMSCPDGERGAGWREQDCFWGRVSRRDATQDGSEGLAGYTHDSTVFQLGGQWQFRPDWFAGASVAYQSDRYDARDGRVSGKGDTVFAGMMLKHQSGPWVFSGALSGGYGSYRMDRSLSFEGYEPRSASSSPDIYSVGARLRAARHVDLGENAYVKPYVDLDAIYTRMPGYQESGPALGLEVAGSDQFVVGVSPMVELGGRMSLDNGGMLRPYAYVGASFLSDAGWEADARLKGSPQGTRGMDAFLPGDKVVGRFGAGVQLHTAAGLDVKLQYDGTHSSKSRSHAGQLKLMYRF